MICNESKRTISTSSELELLRIILEQDTGPCASEDARPPKGWIVRSHIGWRGNEAFLISVWKPLSSRRVLKQ